MTCNRHTRQAANRRSTIPTYKQSLIMVKVTIAGGTGTVAREIFEALAESQRHEVVVLSRSSTPPEPPLPAGVSIQVVDYDDRPSLEQALAGTHTLLSFLQLFTDAGKTAQENLIDAAVAAGVRRIAPSEWSSVSFTDMSFYQNKQAHRDQLERLAQTHDFEYSLIQPGMFLEYLAAPHKTTAYLDPLMTVFDFSGKRAMVVEGREDVPITFTSITDVGQAVLAMVDLPGEVPWPKTAGICGNKLSARAILDMGERIFGQPMTVTVLQTADLEAGELKSPWGLQLSHKAVAAEQLQELLKQVAIGTLLSFSKGAWDSSDEVNRLLPEGFQFTGAEDFLTKVWGAGRQE
ncbi:uncharacterized protein B0I36DRAFT_332349 [Microdochium trichocladiopsis]|uniref:NmrA-like domain-containing protein n=1 Tax=Microdochium trichocladiopsis TaxID=1682393 RepID=A0A9P8XY59_9PEZI|nr:uncharacterized protein B0I36DRAFT_332349 [Microdochium trichocladiopsis]KAH7024978.1 hypothetical protein B0I36DRAFT_332349 [Microdochium trichocladiopsis]